MSARPSGSLPSTSATRRRRIVARRARCQLDTGPIRPAPRSLPREWSRPQDQEDDRPTRLASWTNRITRSSLRSSLRRFGSGAHDVIPDLRSVLTSGLASLAAGADRPKGRRPHAPARRTVRPPARHGARHAARRRAVGARRASRRERAWSSSWQARRPPSACKRFGHAARPRGRRAGGSRRASEASPGVSTALGGYDAVAPLPKRCREERSDDRVIRLVAPGNVGWPVVLLVLGSAAVLGSEPFGRAQARWRRSRSSGADARLMDERPAERLAAVDERYAPSTAHCTARAVPARHGTHPTGSALTAQRVGPNPRPGGRQGQPVLPVGRTV